MDLESTENSHAIDIGVLRELMTDVKRRTIAKTEARIHAEEKERDAKRKNKEKLLRRLYGDAIPPELMGEDSYSRNHGGDGDGDDNSQTLRRDGSFQAGSALRASEAQLFRVFQLFDPRNTKLIAYNEIILLLRAVAIDVDDTLLAQIMASSFNAQEQRTITIEQRGGITFSQLVIVLKGAQAASTSKQEARRVFETVLPARGGKVLRYDDFRKALIGAEARITDCELAEIYRYCAVTGNKEGLTLQDWEEVADFISDVGK